jgi:carboxyl-terminal processing protease
MYDRKSIGEGTLKDALQWDVIGSVPHFTYGDLSPYKAQLKTRFNARIQRNPDYVYILAMNDYLNEARAQTKVALRLSTRLKEKKKAEETRLAIENRLRKAKGLKPVTSVDDLDKDKDDTPRTKPAGDDAELVEGGNILVDLINLNGRANGSAQTRANAQ